MDKTSLTRLFESSLRQWGISGYCRPSGGEMLGVDFTLNDGTEANLCRDTTTGSRLPVWRLCIGDRRPMEAGSLRVVLGVLRTELDESYRPGKVIIGIQPDRAQPAESAQ